MYFRVMQKIKIPSQSSVSQAILDEIFNRAASTSSPTTVDLFKFYDLMFPLDKENLETQNGLVCGWRHKIIPPTDMPSDAITNSSVLPPYEPIRYFMLVLFF